MILKNVMLPFERTVCACDDCSKFCRLQPGHLIPRDLERISEAQGFSSPFLLKPLLWASPGAIVGYQGTGNTWHIGTITPRLRKPSGRCVFLNDDGACVVHEVAPFGCAYFDEHMTDEEHQQRSLYGLRLIAQDWVYNMFRSTLQLAGQWRPS